MQDLSFFAPFLLFITLYMAWYATRLLRADHVVNKRRKEEHERQEWLFAQIEHVAKERHPNEHWTIATYIEAAREYFQKDIEGLQELQPQSVQVVTGTLGIVGLDDLVKVHLVGWLFKGDLVLQQTRCHINLELNCAEKTAHMTLSN